MDTYRAVDPAEAEEMEPGGEIEELVLPDATDEAPSPEAEPQDATSRTQQETTAPRKNLDDDPDFRKWKSLWDRQDEELRRQLADEQRRRAELEAVAEQSRQQQAQAQLAQLERLLDETEDPAEQRRIYSQMANLRAADEVAAWQRWIAHVAQQAMANGLDPKQFDPMSYQGPAGAMQFERDLAAAKAKKLEQEVEAARKAASPESIDEVVRRKLAQAMQQQGLNTVDLAQPKTAPVNTTDAWQRDAAALQAGRLDPATFIKRWGDRR
jgi:hypothetical protein